MKPFFTFFGMACLFCIGFAISWFSKNFPTQASYTVITKVAREPSAIKKTYDFSHLEGSALNYAAKQRLLDGAAVIHDRKDIGIELGHFVIRGSDGQKVFACQRYSKIVMAFEGEGVATSGEPPHMEVEGTCEISDDINRIAAVWIPVSKIMGEPVGDSEFDFRENHPSKLKFANVSDQWPTLWQLKSLRLIDPTGENGEVAVPTSELKQILKKPFLVQF
ncbi:MAG: hypothetical protein ACAH59_09640 [Pseudobdellovibrionaceae bacterium]